jgi:hypothetical protein
MRSSALWSLFIATFLVVGVSSSFGQTAFSLEDWMKKDYNFKIDLVKGFIEFAKKEKITIRLSPEYYVREIDSLIANTIQSGDDLTPSLGVSLKTIAVMDCDWDNGKDPLEEARALMGKAIFEDFRKNYPEKYGKLANGCR